LQKPFTLTPAHETILKSVYTYYYLTAKQVCRLHYSPGSFTRVEKLLKELRDNEYLQWDFLPVKRRFGSSPAYYMPARRGVAHLRKLGFDVSMLPYPSEKKELKSLFLPHTLTVNDVLIAAFLLEKTVPDIRLAAMKHELFLKRTMQGVVPDGWLDFRLHEKEQVCFSLEIDRGTEDQKPFRQKIRALVRFAKGSYAKVFETPSITIVFATPAGALRLNTIRAWTEKELTELHETAEADLFRLGEIPDTEFDPRWLFLEPHWYRPFDTTPVALFS